MHDGIQISGLDLLYALLLQHADELDHVALDEVIHRQRRVQVARINFTPGDLSSQLDRLGDALDEMGDDTDEDEDISDATTTERTHPYGQRSALAEAAEDPSADDEEDDQEDDQDAPSRRLCRAVLLWVADEVRVVMRNRPRCSFRLRMHGPKGGHIESQCFRADNDAYRPARPTAEAPAPPPPTPPAPAPPASPPQLPVVAPPPPLPLALSLPAPAPSPPPPPPPRSTPAVAIALGGDGQSQLIFLDPDTIPEARVWRALGLATEDLLRRSGVAYGNIIELQSRTVLHQASQLDKSNALIESLATQLLAARQVQAADESEQKVDERQLRVREELGKTFLSELGSLGRVLASSKLGLSPELAELGDLVASSPELAEALREPQVRALLKNEETRKELTHILRFAASRTSGGGTPPQAA